MRNIYSAKHLNENLLHLNRYGTIEFAKNFKTFLYKLNWQDLDNSQGFDQYEASLSNFIRNTFHSDHNENLNENGSEESILFFEYNNKNLIDDLIDNRSFDPSKVLSDIWKMNSIRLIITQLNINSLRRCKNFSYLIGWTECN